MMKRQMTNTFFSILSIAGLCILISCKDDDFINTDPTISDQTFTIDENSEVGTIIGTLDATDVDMSQQLTYSILSDNSNNTFSLNSSGQLSVNNSEALDFEANQEFELSVEVEDDLGGSADATITINVNNINEIPVDGLVAFYAFNGNADDASGNNHTGTVDGATLEAGRNGSSNSAYSFDGINDRINIDGILSSVSSDTKGSFSFWVKIPNSSPSVPSAFLSFGDQNNRNFISAYLWSDGLLRFASIKNNAEAFLTISNSPELEANTWHHLAFVQDGVQPKIYLDGSAVSTFNSSSADLSSWFSDVTAIDNVAMGVLDQNNKLQFYLDGSLDDVRIYNRDLTPLEVLKIYEEIE